VLGGAITETLGWEWVFLVNVAPCAVAAALIRVTVPESRGARQRLDVPGALACTAGLALVIVGLSHDLPWIVAGAAVLAGFAAIERRVPAPLLPPHTFRNAQLRDAVIASVVITTASTGPLFLCVLYLQDQLEQGASAAGLLFAPVNLAVIAGSVAATRLDRRRATAAGLAILGAGAAALLALPDHPPVPATLTLAFIAIGGGIGAAALGATSAGTAAADEDRRGLASGLLNTGAQLGNALGPAVCVPLAAAAGAKAAFVAAAALAGIAALWSVR
jgi:predicted MFS family arabinose efflux permease